MTDMIETVNVHDELITMLISAVGADRNIDAHIADWIDPQYIGADAPNYTGSIDDALTLVRPGDHWRVERTCEHPALAFRTFHFTAFCGDYGTPKQADGPTPAVALCLAAILRRTQGENTP